MSILDFHRKPRRNGVMVFNVPAVVPSAEAVRCLLSFGALELYHVRQDRTGAAYSVRAVFLQTRAADSARQFLQGRDVWSTGTTLRVEHMTTKQQNSGLLSFGACVRMLNECAPLAWCNTITRAYLGPPRHIDLAAVASGTSARSSVANVDEVGPREKRPRLMNARPAATDGEAALAHSNGVGGRISEPVAPAVEELGAKVLRHRCLLSALNASHFQRSGGVAPGGSGGEETDEPGAEDCDHGARFWTAADDASEGSVLSGKERWMRDALGRRQGFTAAFAQPRFGAAKISRTMLAAGGFPQCARDPTTALPLRGRLPRGVGAFTVSGAAACAHVSMTVSLPDPDGFMDHINGTGGCACPAPHSASAACGSLSFPGPARGIDGPRAGHGGAASACAGGSSFDAPRHTLPPLFASGGSAAAAAFSYSGGGSSSDWPAAAGPLELGGGHLLPGRFRGLFSDADAPPQLSSAHSSTYCRVADACGDGSDDMRGDMAGPEAPEGPEELQVTFLTLAPGGQRMDPVVLQRQLEEMQHQLALEQSYADNGERAAQARAAQLRERLDALQRKMDRSGLEVKWGQRRYDATGFLGGAPAKAAAEMALRDACRQVVLAAGPPA
jgi:hypothetical protein